MKPLDINRDTALPILRALKTIALADGIFESRQREFVEKHQKDFGLDTNLDALAPISPDELAAAIPNSDTRLAIVQRMVIVALLDEVQQAINALLEPMRQRRARLEGPEGEQLVLDVIRNGIRKINVATDVLTTMIKTYTELSTAPGFKYNTAIYPKVKDAMKEFIKGKMNDFRFVK